MGKGIDESQLVNSLDKVIKYNEEGLSEIINKDEERKVFEEYRDKMVRNLVNEIKGYLQGNREKSAEDWVSRLNTMSISNLIDNYSYDDIHDVIIQVKQLNKEGE